MKICLLSGQYGQRDRVRHRRPVVGVAAGDVRHRQEGDQHAGAVGAEPRLDREQPERGGLGVADVPVGEHGGLGGAGGARGVDQRGQVVGAHLAPGLLEQAGRGLRLGPAEVEQARPADHARDRLPAVLGAGPVPDPGVGLGVDDDDLAELRQLAPDRLELVQVLPLHDRQRRLAVARDVRALIGRDRGVDEHRDAPGVHHRVVADRRLGPVARPDDREIPGPQADRGQAEGGVAHLVIHLPVGQRSPLAVLQPLVRNHLRVLRHRLRIRADQRGSGDLGLDRGALGGHVGGDIGPIGVSHADHCDLRGPSSARPRAGSAPGQLVSIAPRPA